MRTSAICVFALVSAAMPVSAASSVKIAYVDLNRALNDVEDGKSAKVRLRKDFARKQKQLDKLQSNLKKEKEEFEEGETRFQFYVKGKWYTFPHKEILKNA